MYLVQDFQDNTSGSSYLSLYTITGTFGAFTFTQVSMPFASAWATTSTNDLGAQKGSTVKINCADDRFTQVIWKEGYLWCAHTIFLPANAPTHTAVQWWQINPTNSVVVQNGRIEDTSGIKSYAFPSIAVNKFKDVLVGYASFSTNQYASGGYSFHACNDAAGTMQSETIFKAGIAPYYKTVQGRNRWGDYSSTWVDPVNDADFWTVQEYAKTNVGSVTTDGSGRWGTWWAKVPVVFPGNDNFANAYSITNYQGSTNGTVVRAGRETSEPNHSGNANTPSVWYSWTAPKAGNVTFTAAPVGLKFDHVIAVYTGSAVGSLTLVTNGHGLATLNLTFNASSNTVYRIAIAGFNGACGEFTLSWLQPSAPVFTLQPVGRDVFTGSNVTFTAMAIGVPDPVYQWRFNGTNISGATSSLFTTNNVSTNTTGNFTVVATNSSGSMTSVVAHLEVYSTQRALLSDFGYLTNTYHSVVSGITGANYVVEASTNLINWSPIQTNQTTFTNYDRSVTNYPYRFYRALYKP